MLTDQKEDTRATGKECFAFSRALEFNGTPRAQVTVSGSVIDISLNQSNYEALSHREGETFTKSAEKSPFVHSEEDVLAGGSSDRKVAVNTFAFRIGQKNGSHALFSKTYEAGARRNKVYAEEFFRRAKHLENLAKDHKLKSEKHQTAALEHGKKASEYSKLSRESRKAAEDFETIAAQYLTRSKSEIRSYAIAEAESKEALITSKGYETESKNHYAWANELRARAQNLLEQAKYHKALALQAQKNANHFKQVAETENINSKIHMDKANKFESRQVQSDIKAKEFLREYEDYLLKSASETNFARQSRIKAIYEDILAQVFSHTSSEVRSLANIEEGEYANLKSKGKIVEEETRKLITALDKLEKVKNDLQVTHRAKGIPTLQNDLIAKSKSVVVSKPVV
ncbi:hypothetical protein C0J52_24421 [Blattella germanica]|nr:hypothetical protein C0J52_24421 [Blattella germanica]